MARWNREARGQNFLFAPGGVGLTSAFWPDLDPPAIARGLRDLWWPELDELALEVTGRLRLVAEGASASLQAHVASGKPGSAAPSGGRSLADEHEQLIFDACSADLLDVENGQAPRRYGYAVLAAATALWRTKHRGRSTDDPDPDHAGVERHDAILAIYVDLDPAAAAVIETERAGFVSPGAIRTCRRENGRHGETGRPVPLGEQRKREVRRLNAAGMPLRRIAKDLDIGTTTVSRILALGENDHDPELETAA